MRIIPTLTKTVAAAALTIGLVAGAPAAQATPLGAPAAPTAAHVQHTHHVGSATVTKKAAKARTRIAASAPSTVKAGDDLTITAKLTRKAGKKYKPFAKKKVELVLLDAPGADTGSVIVTKKTNKKGKVTFVLETTSPEVVGKTFDFLVAFEGGSRAKAAESQVLTVSITQ